MKNKKVLILLIIIILIITIIIFFIKNNYKFSKKGNNISNKSADEIKEYILNIDSYQTTATITVKSNKNENTYVVKQKYNKENNVYKQEIIEPENIAGVQFTYNGTELKVENTKLNLSKIYQDYNYIGSNELSLIKFIEDYKNLNNSKYYEENGKFILETNSQNENKYTMKKKLYMNKESGKIEKMEIQDRTQNTRIYILYNEIEINSLSKEEVVAFSIKIFEKGI